MIADAIYRYDRHGRKTFVTSPATQRALAILAAADQREKALARQSTKARQDAGELTPSERLLAGIFGEMK